MDAYTSFAEVYDTFMDNIDYEVWGEYLHGLLKAFQVSEGVVAELGCGTGSMTEILAARGYDMIGIDAAVEMLQKADQKRVDSGHDILYLNQDMRELELYGTVKAVVCICDSLNYITEPEELCEVFRLVNRYLDPGGVFIFDFNTEYKYREILGEQTIAENRDEGSFIWENYYDSEDLINEYDLTLFIKAENGYYQKYEETHYQRAYTLPEIKQLIDASGLIYVTAYDAFSEAAPQEKSERIYVVAREAGKVEMAK